MHTALSHVADLLSDPYLWALYFLYWNFSNAIGALPKPDTKDSKFYGWFFKYANGVNGNLTRAFAGKIPGSDNPPPPPPETTAEPTQQQEQTK